MCNARRKVGLTWLLGLAAALSLGCGSDEPPDMPMPNVFLISLDTLRKDAVGAYRRDVASDSNTPVLDAFAREAVTLDGARTPMPFTLPAHMSLLTGVAPRVHGVSKSHRLLSDRLGTLPEWLRAAGFETHGIAVNYWMKGAFGFERGFDSYQLVEQGLVSSGRVNAALGPILASRDPEGEAEAAGDRPLFVFVQYFDAHSASRQVTPNTLPYYSPPEYREDLAPVSEREFCDAVMGCATGFLTGADAARRDVSPEMLARLRVLYDRSVRHLDAQLGEFFQQLRRRHIYDDSLVIVTSDHGEAFREHGSFLHSQTYDETLAVPLLVKLPSRMGAARGGERAVGLATLEDVAPTILDVLGLPVPDTVQGVSLLPLLLRGEPVRQQLVSQDRRRRSRHALVADGHKLIYDFDDGSVELYDLAADPMEARDLAAAQPQRTAALQRQLALRVRENTRLAEQFRAAAPDGVLRTDEREALRAIGYLEE